MSAEGRRSANRERLLHGRGALACECGENRCRELLPIDHGTYERILTLWSHDDVFVVVSEHCRPERVRGAADGVAIVWGRPVEIESPPAPGPS